ncbi:MAG TPA: molybdenum cofactor guanylyltransferase [Vicinamibacterales bacterium]|jgi:molybdopterin-guanine dinucleotide biosynthesis protein A|nr:molybdenum cofactor guanylyltransferase [Vicinamibacterales bacterium]
MPSAAILAGGLARRFGGRDKSALVIGGLTILNRQLRVLTCVSDDVMVVVASDRAMPLPAPMRPITDRRAGKGPIAGLGAALAEARHRELILVACDMPFLDAGFLAYLVSRAAQVDAVVPRTERGYHPLCAVYTREAAPFLARALDADRLRMNDLMNEMAVRDVRGEEIDAFGPRGELLANVNSPSEFEELEALSGHKL